LTRFVLDCSVTMSWCFEDEQDSYATAILDMLGPSQGVTPSMWPLEVANVLLVGERRNRLTRAASSRFLALLASLPLTIDETAPVQILDKILALARQHDLSSYDAAYLELAMREGLPIATLDEKLRRAAQSSGIAIVGA